jgi:hypothetical protein
MNQPTRVLSPPPYYSDRHELRGAPVVDVGAEFWQGFIQIYQHIRNEGLLIAEFGSSCGSSENFIDVGLDDRLNLRMRVEIGLDWSYERRSTPPQPHVALDCVEFFARRVRSPTGYHWHQIPGWFNSHRDYVPPFDRVEGLREYSELVNGLLRVHSHPFQLVGERVTRRGEPEFESVVSHRAIETGDTDLDSLVEQARTAYWSMNSEQRRLAVERAWDAFERVKTVIDPDKKRGMGALLDHAASSPKMREVLEIECRELTRVGNEFQIRHREVGKAPIREPDDVDYLFYRVYLLLTRLLPHLPRIGTANREIPPSVGRPPP